MILKNIRIRALKNGTKVAFIKIPYFNSINVIATVKAGPIFENQNNNGTSHFLEHLLFNGSKDLKEEKLVEESELLGFSYSGTCSRNWTDYNFHFPAKNFIKSFDLIKKILFKPSLEKEKIERERKVIFEEFPREKGNIGLEKYRVTIKNRIKNIKNPYLLEVLGKRENVLKTTQSDLKKWHNRFYSPNNFVFCLAGKITPKIEKKFIKQIEEIKKGKEHEFPKIGQEDLTGYKKVVKRKNDLDKVLFELNFPIKGFMKLSKKEIVVDGCIVNSFGRLRSSILFQELRQKQGIYYFDIKIQRFADWGFIYIETTTTPEAFNKCRKEIINQIKKIKEKGFPELIIRREKEFANSKDLLYFDEYQNIMNHVINQMLTKQKIILPEELIKTRENVTKKEIDQKFRKLFDFSKANEIIFIPKSSK